MGNAMSQLPARVVNEMDELKPMEWNDGSSVGNEIMPTIDMLSASAMEQRNEPTTAEIVKETRLCSQPDWNCDKCSRNGMPFGDCFTELYLQAADRLEQLERENAALRESNGRFAQAVSELTMQAGAAITRAEKAEANVEDAHQRGYEEGMDEARHQYEEDGYV